MAESIARQRMGNGHRRASRTLVASFLVLSELTLSACAGTISPVRPPSAPSPTPVAVASLAGVASQAAVLPPSSQPSPSTAPSGIAGPLPTGGGDVAGCSPMVVPNGAVATYHVPVLMYHRIEPRSERGHDPVDLVVDPTVFEAQLAALKARGWNTITSAQLAATMRAGCSAPPKTFVVTLDDGHQDGYSHAFPILEKYGFVATFFIITSRVGRPRYLTWPEMLEMQAAGMEIGSHTVSHVDEATYDRLQTDAQVLGAQRAIELQLQRRPVSFAYPYGLTPTNLVASVKASDIEVAYTTARGVAESLGNAYLLPRIRIGPTTHATNLVVFLDRYR
jgi:peptidoglycan/xylan/chitin deacetylase (PgdA/CDA1 family)